MTIPVELLIELVVIAALYGLFNSLLDFSKKPKYEMIYGTLVILVGPANYFYFGFEIQGLFHSIIGFLIMIIGWNKWHKFKKIKPDDFMTDDIELHEKVSNIMLILVIAMSVLSSLIILNIGPIRVIGCVIVLFLITFLYLSGLLSGLTTDLLLYFGIGTPKWCSSCKGELNGVYWWFGSYLIPGNEYYCRECMERYWKARYQKALEMGYDPETGWPPFPG